MNPNQGFQYARDAQRKIFYGVLLAALVLLVLSVQFAPLWGGELWWALLTSWLLFLVSIAAGAWRLGREAVRLGQEADFYSSDDHAAEGHAHFHRRRNTRRARAVTSVQIWSLVLAIFLTLAFAGRNYWVSLFDDPGADGDQCVEDAHI